MKKKMTPLYRVAQVVVPIFYALYSPMIIRRAGPLPEGRMVICSNHLSFQRPALYWDDTETPGLFIWRRRNCSAAVFELAVACPGSVSGRTRDRRYGCLEIGKGHFAGG